MTEKTVFVITEEELKNFIGMLAKREINSIETIVPCRSLARGFTLEVTVQSSDETSSQP